MAAVSAELLLQPTPNWLDDEPGEEIAHGFTRTVWSLPAPACDTCQHTPRRARDLLPCSAFVLYTNGERGRMPGMPQRHFYTRVISGT